LKATSAEFRDLYSADKAFTESLTPQATSQYGQQQRVELAAWTMMVHSLLNLELVKVKR